MRLPRNFSNTKSLWPKLKPWLVRKCPTNASAGSKSGKRGWNIKIWMALKFLSPILLLYGGTGTRQEKRLNKEITDHYIVS